MWKRRKKLDEYLLMPTKHNAQSSAFLLSTFLVLSLLLAAGAYSVVDLYNGLRKSDLELIKSLQRDSILTANKNILGEMISAIETGRTKYAGRNSLMLELNRYKTQLSSSKLKYVLLIESSGDSMVTELLPKAKKYFSQEENIAQRIIAAFIKQNKGGRDVAVKELTSIRAKYNALMGEDFKALWQKERQCILEQEFLRSHNVSMYSLLWLLLSILHLGLLMILALLLVRRNRAIIFGLKRSYALLECATNPVQIIDCNGVTRYVNPRFETWSGMKLSALLGKNLFDLIRKTNQEESSKDLWVSVKQTLLFGDAWTNEVEFTRPDERTIIAGITLSPIFCTRGKLQECVAIFNDLTERKEFKRKIVETQRQYRSIVESSLDGIMIIQEGKLVFANPSAVRLFGYTSSDEMQKLNLSDTIAPPNRSSLEIKQEGRSVGEEVLRNYEMRGVTKQSKIIDLEANAHIVEWNDRLAIQASFRDITKRKMLEREQSLWLWEQETLSNIDRKLVGIMDLEKIFAAILQQTLNLTRAHFAGVLLFDESTTSVEWKAIRGNTLQHTFEPFIPQGPLNTILVNEAPNIINESDNDTLLPFSQIPVVGEEKLISTAWMPLLVENKQKGKLIVGYRHYHEFLGREMRLLVSLAEKHSIAMVNAQLYMDLLQREKELEILSGARVQAQENERRRIAREIHDGLGQMLTAIKFNLEILEDMITPGREEQGRIEDMKKLLDDVMKEAREISYNLMPSVLEDFGLAPALQLLSEQFTKRTSIKVQFHSHGITERFDPQLEIGLYRIVQESFNNIAKHSEATEVSLQLIRSAEGFRLVVEDNGKGIATQLSHIRATGRGGMGLVSMRERASSFGGVLTIDSMPKSGTLITVEIPLKKINHE